MDFALDHRTKGGNGTATCKANAINKPTAGAKCVTFHRRGGKAVHVWRSPNRKLRAHNRNQCRAGTGKSFKAHRFVKRLDNGKCPRRA